MDWMGPGGTGPVLDDRNRAHRGGEEQAGGDERAEDRESQPLQIERDGHFHSLFRPADHPPVMQRVLRSPCQMRKMAEKRHFLNLKLNAGFTAVPRLGGLHQQSVSACGRYVRFRTFLSAAPARASSGPSRPVSHKAHILKSAASDQKGWVKVAGRLRSTSMCAPQAKP